ncbi:MAG: ribosome silencing factor [Chitinivibrionales bacterium]|nr:ribosome silencing factor [Chitinivibrionales bacterium]
MKQATLPMFNQPVVDLVIPQLLEKKADEIIVFNPGQTSSVADWYILCQGTNEIHNKAIADHLLSACKGSAAPSFSEGTEDGRWIIIDFIEVVVIIILPQLRQYYGFEELWHDIPATPVSSVSDDQFND